MIAMLGMTSRSNPVTRKPDILRVSSRRPPRVEHSRNTKDQAGLVAGQLAPNPYLVSGAGSGRDRSENLYQD